MLDMVWLQGINTPYKRLFECWAVDCAATFNGFFELKGCMARVTVGSPVWRSSLLGEPEQEGTFMARVELKQIPQICVVVRDVQEAMERYWKSFGIGPWQVYTMAPPLMTEMTIREKPEPYSMRIALAQVGNIQWELIQPLTGQSIYKEFLEQSGEGVHHVLSVVDDYDKALAGFKATGMQPLMGGTWRGATFMYVDARKQLGIIVEIFKTNPDFALPEPEATYPAGK